MLYYVSHITMETFCFAVGLCLFKLPRSVVCHWYNEDIPKKCRSVRQSFLPFVTLKNAFSIINSKIIIRILGERVWHPVQENVTLFKNNIFVKNFRPNFREKIYLLFLLVVEGCFSYQVKGIDVLYKKIKCYFWKIGCWKI